MLQLHPFHLQKFLDCKLSLRLCISRIVFGFWPCKLLIPLLHFDSANVFCCWQLLSLTVHCSSLPMIGVIQEPSKSENLIHGVIQCIYSIVQSDHPIHLLKNWVRERFKCWKVLESTGVDARQSVWICSVQQGLTFIVNNYQTLSVVEECSQILAG